MGNCCGQQHPQPAPSHTDNGGFGEQTTVYIYVKLQPTNEGNWDWNHMLQEISDVKYIIIILLTLIPFI